MNFTDGVDIIIDGSAWVLKVIKADEANGGEGEGGCYSRSCWTLVVGSVIASLPRAYQVTY
jgi:hypothetical protein